MWLFNGLIDLRSGFDQELAGMIGKDMEIRGVKFVKGAVPTLLSKADDGKIRVQYHLDSGLDQEDFFDTVIFLILLCVYLLFETYARLENLLLTLFFL